jgi:hypothetical protein
MTEAEPGAVDQVAAEHGTGWGLMVGAGAVACFAIGFAVGVSGPVSIFSSDAQWGLLILLLGIPVAVVFGLIAVVSFLVGHFPRFSGSVFLASLVIMGGDVVGAGVGDTLNLAGWAQTPAPSFLIPDRHSANATVTVAMVGQRAFVATEPGPMGDGLSGQWCTSEPDSFGWRRDEWHDSVPGRAPSGDPAGTQPAGDVERGDHLVLRDLAGQLTVSGRASSSARVVCIR